MAGTASTVAESACVDTCACSTVEYVDAVGRYPVRGHQADRPVAGRACPGVARAYGSPGRSGPAAASDTASTAMTTSIPAGASTAHRHARRRACRGPAACPHSGLGGGAPAPGSRVGRARARYPAASCAGPAGPRRRGARARRWPGSGRPRARAGSARGAGSGSRAAGPWCVRPAAPSSPGRRRPLHPRRPPR